MGELLLGFAKGILIVFLVLAVSIVSVWGGLALWYRLPAPEILRALVAAGFFLCGMAAAIAIAGFLPFRTVAIFAVLFGALLLWWSTIKPPAEAEWSPDVARQVTGAVNGDTLTLTNVRDFEWRGETDFTERWETRTYDLRKIQTLDLFLSYWAGPEMAHGHPQLRF